LEDRTKLRENRNNHINWPVRTACAVVQHHNAAIHITMHNTQYTQIVLLL